MTSETFETEKVLALSNRNRGVARTSRKRSVGIPGGRPIVVVLGMHRSGTSLVSNVLHFLGVDMADETDPVSPKNAGGFWERPALVALHDRLLEVIGRPIASPLHCLPFPAAWWRRKEVQPLKREMQAWLKAQLDQTSGLWGFKDPRTCRLLPLWWDVFRDLGLHVHYVFAVRSPAESAISMSEKNPAARPMTATQGELMWLVYNYDMLRYANGADPFIVDYQDWFRDPVRVAEAMSRHLNLEPDLTPREMADCVHSLVRPDLRHKIEGQSSVASTLPMSLPFYKAIVERAELVHGGEDPTGRHVDVLDVVFRFMEPVVHLLAEVPGLRAAAAESKKHEQRVAAAETALSHTQRDLRSMGEQLATATARLAEKDLALAETSGQAEQIADLGQKLQAADGHNAELSARLEELTRKRDEERAQSQQRTKELEKRKQTLEADIASTEEKVRNLGQVVAEAERKLLAADTRLQEERLQFTHRIKGLEKQAGEGRDALKGQLASEEKKARASVEAAKETADRLKAAEEALSIAQNESRGLNEQLGSARADMKDKEAALAKTRQQAEQAAAEAGRELKAAQSRIGELDKALAEQRRRADEERAALMQRLEDSEKQRHSLKADIAHSEGRVRAAAEEVEATTMQLRGAEVRIADLEKALAHQRGQAEEERLQFTRHIERQEKHTREEQNAFKAQLASAGEKVSTLTDAVQDTAHRLKATEESLSVAQTKSRRLDEQLGSARADIKEREEALAKIQQQVDQAAAEAGRTLNAAESRIGELEKILDEQRHRADEERAALTHSLEDSEKRRHSLKVDLASAEERVGAAGGVVEAKSQQLRTAEVRIAELEERLADERGEAGDERAQLTKRLRELEQRLAEKEELYKSYQGAAEDKMRLLIEAARDMGQKLKAVEATRDLAQKDIAILGGQLARAEEIVTEKEATLIESRKQAEQAAEKASLERQAVEARLGELESALAETVRKADAQRAEFVRQLEGVRQSLAAAEADAELARAEAADMPRLKGTIEALQRELTQLQERQATGSARLFAVAGEVEDLIDGAIVGWACYPDHPEHTVILEIFVDGVFGIAAMANRPRTEPRFADKRGGRCGFTVSLSSLPIGAVSREVRVRLAGSTSNLAGSPMFLRKIGNNYERIATQASAAPVAAKKAPPADRMASLFPRWIAEFDALTETDKPRLGTCVTELVPAGIRFSVLLLPGPTSLPSGPEQTVNSVLSQAYPELELIVPADLHLDIQPLDPRLRRVNAPDLQSLIGAAQGSHVTFVTAGDSLASTALLLAAWTIREAGAFDLLYSDEDRVDLDRQGRSEPHFKGAWDLDLFLAQDYACRMAVLPIEAARHAARPEPRDGAGLYGLLLRVIRGRGQPHILHMPFLAYHRAQGAGPLADEQRMVAAVRKFLKRQASADGVTQVLPLEAGLRRLRWPLPAEKPRVSVVIPTRDKVDLLRGCVEGLLNHTDYDELEVIILDNESSEESTKAYLQQIRQDGRVKVLAFAGPFNYSAINNLGVEHSTGSIVALLNNDIKVMDGGWLEEMVGHAIRPEVGAVGAMLHYGDDTIQHAGVVLGIGGIASHLHKRQPGDHPGHGNHLRVAHEVSAVTAACLLMRRQVWEAVGGLSLDFPVAYNDIDLCLRIRKAGYRIIWTPFARLYHLESASRGKEDSPEKKARFEADKQRMLERWGPELAADPFYSPNLSLEAVDCRPAFPPRVRPPWREIQTQ